MPRGPRHLPPGWSVEITTRTTCGFFLLPATAHFARIFVGILARAQEKYPVRVHAVVALSNHYHLIVTPEDLEQLASFMAYVNGNLAGEAKRLVKWKGAFWADRYHMVPISPEPQALVDRLRYVLSHSVKENLVARVADWEGLHCAGALINGKPLAGIWCARSERYDAQRQAERKAARRGCAVEQIDRSDFLKPYSLQLSPLPCWENLSQTVIGERVAEMVAEIETSAADIREKLGYEPVGMERIRNQDPLTRPVESKRSPKPPCHAASQLMRERFKQAYRSFVEMFREASLLVKLGRSAEAVFPKGCFPPRLPFVRSGEEFDPLVDVRGSPASALWAAVPT